MCNVNKRQQQSKWPSVTLAPNRQPLPLPPVSSSPFTNTHWLTLKLRPASSRLSTSFFITCGGQPRERTNSHRNRAQVQRKAAIWQGERLKSYDRLPLYMYPSNTLVCLSAVFQQHSTPCVRPARPRGRTSAWRQGWMEAADSPAR